MNKFIMQQAQQLQSRLAKAQEELGNITVEASSRLSLRQMGQGSDSVTAITKSQQTAAEHLGGLTGGLKIPGLT